MFKGEFVVVELFEPYGHYESDGVVYWFDFFNGVPICCMNDEI